MLQLFCGTGKIRKIYGTSDGIGNTGAIEIISKNGENTTSKIINIASPLLENDYIDFIKKKIIRSDGTEEEIETSCEIVQYLEQTTIYNTDGANIEVELTSNKAISSTNESIGNLQKSINSSEIKIEQNLKTINQIQLLKSYDLSNYATSNVKSIGRNVCKIKNNIVNISSYLTISSALKANTNNKLFDLPVELLSDSESIDFVFVSNSGIIGRGFVGTKTDYPGIYFRPSAEIIANSPIIFNVSYSLD